MNAAPSSNPAHIKDAVGTNGRFRCASQDRLFSGAQFVCNKPVTGTNDPLREISPIIYIQTQRVREEETTAEVSEPVTLFLVSRQIVKRLQSARKKKRVHRSASVIFNGINVSTASLYVTGAIFKPRAAEDRLSDANYQ